MLDLNVDGNPLDDILRMAGKAMRQPRYAQSARAVASITRRVRT
jgi:hypothetical protein